MNRACNEAVTPRPRFDGEASARRTPVIDHTVILPPRYANALRIGHGGMGRIYLADEKEYLPGGAVGERTRGQAVGPEQGLTWPSTMPSP
jgi:hypothetical protein